MTASIIKNKLFKLLKIVLGALFCIALWEIVAIRADNSYFMPRVGETAKALSVLIGSSGFWKYVFTSLLRVAAGLVLGMTRFQIFTRVTLQQVIKRIIPPMGNEIITLVKDTALARVITVVEIIWCAEQLMSKAIIWPLFYTAVFYLIFVGALTLLFGYLEKKQSYYKI